MKHLGASVPDQALVASDEARSDLHPTGFDPSRVASLPWRDMADFPRDGTICAVMFYPWNVKTNDPRIQFGQWLDLYGSGGKLYEPWNTNSEPFADGWLPLAELASLNAIAMEAQRGATGNTDATAEGGGSAGPQDIAQDQDIPS